MPDISETPHMMVSKDHYPAFRFIDEEARRRYGSICNQFVQRWDYFICPIVFCSNHPFSNPPPF
jgi:hypothetical protein